MQKPSLPTPIAEARPNIVACAPSHLSSIRALLADPCTARPFFGQALRAEALDAWLADNWEAAPGDGEWRLVALDPCDGRLLGAGRVADGTLSYVVASTDWRRGIGTALARALCALASRDPQLRPLSAIVFRDNGASAALLEQLGFRFAGLCPAAAGAFATRERLRYVLARPAAQGHQRPGHAQRIAEDCARDRGFA